MKRIASKKQQNDAEELQAIFAALGFSFEEIALVLHDKQFLAEVKHLYRI